MRPIHVLLLSGIVLTSAVDAEHKLVLNVSPQQSLAPANVNVRITIEPNHANRVVEVVAESDEFYRSSQIAIEGERGPKTIFLQLKNLPSGSYEVRSILSDALGHETASERRAVQVIDTEAGTMHWRSQ